MFLLNFKIVQERITEIQFTIVISIFEELVSISIDSVNKYTLIEYLKKEKNKKIG